MIARIPDYLLRFPKYSDHRSADRLRRLLQAYETDWPKEIRTLHVVGSNGKGSTTILADAIARRNGTPVGRYISPHHMRFSERIAVDGQEIDQGECDTLFAEYRTRIDACFSGEERAQVNFFEVVTYIAYRHFQRRRAATLVVEAGLGGRFDPTRIFPGDKAIAFTSLDYEHRPLLGDSLEQICANKLDISPGAPVHAVLSRMAGAEVLTKIAAASGQQLRDGSRWLTLADDGTQARGVWHAQNVALAVSAVQHLCGKPDDDPALAAAVDSTTGVATPGRFEQICDHPEVYVDVGHTPQTISLACASVRAQDWSRAPILLFGLSNDKDYEALIVNLSRIFSEAIFTKALKRPQEPDLLARAFAKQQPDVATRVIPDLADALAYARERGIAAGRPVVVLGGLYLAIEATAIVSGQDLQDLDWV